MCCDLTKLHEKTLYGDPETVLAALRSNPKAEKGEYCLVLDLHEVPGPDQAKTAAPDLSAEAMLVETCVKEGLSLREAQERLAAEGWKKNEVKRAALALKKMFL